MLHKTVLINDDTDSVSDSDTQPVLNTTVDMTAKSSLKSPWKDEFISKSDFSSNDSEEDLNLPRKSFVKSNPKKSQTVKKNVITKNTSVVENSAEKYNQDQWYKCSSIVAGKKPQNYHSSNTTSIHTKAQASSKHQKTFYLSCDDEPDENNQLMNYDYNQEDFRRNEFMTGAREDTFYLNDFDLQNQINTHKDCLMDNIDCQPYVDIFANEFDESDYLKDYDTEWENKLSSTAFSDFTMNLTQTMTDVNNSDEDTCKVDSRKRANTFVLCSRSTQNISNLGSTKEMIDFSINMASTNQKTIDNNDRKSTIRSYCNKACYFLLFLVKNIILFLVLPVTYIIFFIYIQETDNKQ